MCGDKEVKLPRQDNYETALKIAKEELSRMAVEEQCRAAGFIPVKGKFGFRFLGRPYSFDPESLELHEEDGGPPPDTWERIIVLHHLARAHLCEPTGELISYLQVPEGAPYLPVFNKRTAGILLSAFGERLPALMAAGEKLGGVPEPGLGDLAFKVRPLPKTVYCVVAYFGDEEFPPEIKVLFDSSLLKLLPAEDITVLAQMTCLKLVRVA